MSRHTATATATATATTTTTANSDSDNDNDSDTQRHQLTNVRLNPVQHEKTHQVKTLRQIDSSFLVSSVAVHGRSLLMECFVLLNPSTPESLACLAGQQFFFNICELFILCCCSFHVFLRENFSFGCAVTVSNFTESCSYAATVFPRNEFCTSILWKGMARTHGLRGAR